MDQFRGRRKEGRKMDKRRSQSDLRRFSIVRISNPAPLHPAYAVRRDSTKARREVKQF
jgi:hypothetical protein